MQRFVLWHKTKPGLALVALAELLLAYIAISLAIDRGSWLWYLLALIACIGAGQNVVTLTGKLLHERKRTRV